MAEHAPPGQGGAGANERLGRWLEANYGATPLRRADLPRDATHGWRFAQEVEGRRFDLVYAVDARRPTLGPSIHLAEPPGFPSFPHVERDGKLCLLSPVDEIDPSRPVDVARHLIAGARDVLAGGLTGANTEDFRTEFLSYWNPTARGLPVLSLLDPSGPSRWVAARPDRGRLLVGENGAELRRWLQNAGRRQIPEGALSRVPLTWLPRPMLPGEYPGTVEDLRALAAAAECGGVILDAALASAPRDRVVVMGAPVGDGACFAAVTITTARGGSRARGAARPRRGARGQEVGGSRLVRSAVERADAFWIHGRDGNADLQDLRTAKVGVIGCGSLGSPVARLLALSGVGELVLVDPDTLAWSNVGRHVLGAEAVGMRKAEALRIRLGREFPHSRFEGLPGRWQEHRAALGRCDLIVSTVGGWSDEAEFDAFRRAGGAPPTVYGWSEPHACAGHAVLLAGEGCLACGFDATGGARATVTRWEAAQLRREPACGALYQPYGAVEIGTIGGLVAGLALDALLERADPSTYRLVSTTDAMLEAAGGAWTDAWVAACGGEALGGRTIERRWVGDGACVACGGKPTQ